MSNKPYDPIKYPFQTGVIDNFRRRFKEDFNSTCFLDDKEIWDTSEEWGLCQDDEHSDDNDFCTMEALKELSYAKFLYGLMQPKLNVPLSDDDVHKLIAALRENIAEGMVGTKEEIEEALKYQKFLDDYLKANPQYA